MGHRVSGLLATRPELVVVAETLGEPPPASLGDGLAFLPVEWDDVGRSSVPDLDLPESDDGNAEDEEELKVIFVCRAPALIEKVAPLSTRRSVAYIETEYFGGRGGQGAFLCRDGRLASIPDWSPHGAINRVLRLLGVSPGRQSGSDAYSRYEDEFDAVGLAGFRDNDSWRAAARAERTQ